jgi:biotin carboxyl carrier protein
MAKKDRPTTEVAETPQEAPQETPQEDQQASQASDAGDEKQIVVSLNPATLLYSYTLADGTTLEEGSKVSPEKFEELKSVKLDNQRVFYKGGEA